MHKRAVIAVAWGAVTASVLAFGLSAARADPQNFGEIERGHYLVTAADCFACHTVPNVGTPFAGGRAIETPFGNVTSANITPDRATGIGAWTEAQFEKAVREGVRPNGQRLYPAMPFPYYTRLSHDDVKAMWSYLRTIAPAHNNVQRDTLPFPFSIRGGMRLWDALFFRRGAFKPDEKKSDAWNRGAYLVTGAGHCGACHTPKNFLGGDKSGEALQGARLQGWFAPNITNDNLYGLGRWSVDEIASFLRTGHNPITAATGPMGEEISFASSGLTSDDLKAIATYLKSLPGQSSPARQPVKSGDPVMTAGQAIYRDQCAACHMINGKGVPRLFPSLADSAMMRADDPRSAIRIVLRGARSVATDAEPTAPGMPSYGGELNDQEIAAVLTYVRRNAWGPIAPAATAGEVASARAALKGRSD